MAFDRLSVSVTTIIRRAGFYRAAACAICAVLIVFSHCGVLRAQTVDRSSQSPSPPVFRTSTRQVLLDVVVLDSQGHPVPGLKSQDFKVFEDGKPQRLASFDEHARRLVTQSAKPFHLPPHQYTNVPVQENDAPLTVILFDTLNTPAADQTTARDHMLRFLKALPAGQPAGLFALGTRLTVVQSFTGSSEVLVAAASKLLASPSSLLVTEADRQHQEDDAIYRERMMAPSMSGGTGPSTSQTTLTNPLVVATQKLREALAEQEESTIDQRVGLTLQALSELAQMLRGYPGRKNLIWLSGAFPFSLGPNPFLHSDHPDDRQFDSAVRATTNLLSSAQVAVYPVDVGGIRGQGIGLSSTGEGASGVDSTTGASRLGSTLMRQLTASTDEHATMDEVAEQTGGRAFYGTNDLQSAMQRSVEEGSTYYTLAYSPQNQEWNGKFRRIEVKMLRSGYRLQYRRGYFALQEPEHSTGDSTRKLVAALRPDMPNSTSLYLKAEILPPDAEHQAVRITCLIDPQQVTFTDTPNGGKHATIDLLTVVWDDRGKDVGHNAQTVEANLDEAQYKAILRSGIQVSESVPVGGRAYRVRLGAVDRASQVVGTLDVEFDDK